MLRGLIVFGITYLLVATRRLKFVRLDRPAGSIIGAVLAVVLGAVTPEEASKAVDHTTIILLFAVMGMGAFLSLDGFFERAGQALVARMRTRRRLVAAVLWGAGLLAAVVTNDAVCVLAAPLVVGWIERYKLPRLPLLAALTTGANTGSVATLVGNPQNMLCGSLGHLHFAQFLVRMVPVALLALVINHAVLIVLFRRDLDGELPPEPIPERVFTLRSAVTMTVILATVVVYTLGGSLSFTALAGLAVLLLVHREDPALVWQRIDWSVLLFFGGLFVAVDALARSGAASWAFAHFPLLGHDGAGTFTGWLRATVIFLVGSNVVTNVPFILIVKPEMAGLPDPTLGWQLLAMASTFAGNLTLLGSVANVIVAEKAEPVGGMHFREYLKFGLPVGALTTLAGACWLVLTR
ncbi:Arsenic efflux pump protein [Labilithrix luteola]|uniref:Arsenic efflux pump protein n=1 Tax=Labilithrix luteola TaxID=1391654 RepID=A0A0K1Q965_9BACT|nr:SLC13 family permease [Labilithrix luteola]AKV02274.1 Arsenic efflux pump protein [Labilithrix luteola]